MFQKQFCCLCCKVHLSATTIKNLHTCKGQKFQSFFLIRDAGGGVGLILALGNLIPLGQLLVLKSDTT